jgi:CRISPR-associated protein Csa3
VIAEGIDAGDQIALLQPDANFKDDTDYASKRASEETESLVQFFEQIDEKIRIVSVPVTCNPFEVAVREASALVTNSARATNVGIPQNRAEEKAPQLGTKAVETILCVGGGPRELLFAVHTAAAAHTSHVSKTVLLGDLNTKPSEVNIPRINPYISDRVEETFYALIDETPPLTDMQITDMDDAVQTELTVTEISESTGKSKSTIGRHLDTLEEEGVLSSTRRGKERVAQLTLSAELYLREQQPI